MFDDIHVRNTFFEPMHIQAHRQLVRSGEQQISVQLFNNGRWNALLLFGSDYFLCNASFSFFCDGERLLDTRYRQLEFLREANKWPCMAGGALIDLRFFSHRVARSDSLLLEVFRSRGGDVVELEMSYLALGWRKF